MDALDAVKPGQKVLLVLCREPVPLYRALELNGVSWALRATTKGISEF